MKKLKRNFTLRTALIMAVTLALVSSAAVFMSISASENVTPSDESPTSPSAGRSVKASVTYTDVSASDETARNGELFI